MSYEPPQCCGTTCGWAERAGVWVCEHRSHHRFNDFGEQVDENGDTALRAEIAVVRRAHPSRNLG